FVLGAPRVAELVHLPLGLAGFAGAALLYLWVLRRWAPRVDVPAHTPRSREPWAHRRIAIASFAALTLLAVVLSPGHTPNASAGSMRFRLELPHAKEIPLSGVEARHFDGFSDVDARKWRLEGAGTVLAAYTENFRAHHHPERCFGEAGLDVSRAETVAANDGLVVMRLGSAAGPRGYYWFQSRDRVTADYADRVFASVVGRENAWVLVSVLLPRSSANDSDLLQTFHRAVKTALEDSP
ncbi:MAG: hypothetical protein AAF658_03625, partial [Myxococcota bacterium]